MLKAHARCFKCFENGTHSVYHQSFVVFCQTCVPLHTPLQVGEDDDAAPVPTLVCGILEVEGLPDYAIDYAIYAIMLFLIRCAACFFQLKKRGDTV